MKAINTSAVSWENAERKLLTLEAEARPLVFLAGKLYYNSVSKTKAEGVNPSQGSRH